MTHNARSLKGSGMCAQHAGVQFFRHTEVGGVYNSTHELAAGRKGVNHPLAPCGKEASEYGVNHNLAAHTPGSLMPDPNHTSEGAEVT